VIPASGRRVAAGVAERLGSPRAPRPVAQLRLLGSSWGDRHHRGGRSSVSHEPIERAGIVDLAPTVLALLGVEAEPSSMGGRSLPSPHRRPGRAGGGRGRVIDQTVYSGDEERAISERLEALGYE
jgi:hypothetical protein